MSDPKDDAVAPGSSPNEQGLPPTAQAEAPASDVTQAVEAGDAASAVGDTQAPAESVSAGLPAAQSREAFISRNFFWLLAGILLLEIFIYGWRGDIQVCVAKDGIHDFKLIGTAPTEENRWQVPRCEERTNLSMFSHYDEAVANAKHVACGKAASFKLRGEKDACIRSGNGWKWRVESSHVMPWDLRIYKTMFHLD